MAGAFTESTVIGTASDTIDRLDIPEAEKTRLKNNIPVAYAVSYLVGTGFVVWFLSAGAPRLLRVDLKAESRKLASQVSSADQSSDHAHLAYKEWSIRAYRLADAAAGRTVADFERSEPPSASSSNASGEAPSSSMPRRRPFCKRRCRRHRGAAESAARWKPAAWRGSRGPRAARLSDGDLRRGGDEARGGGATTLRPGPTARARRRPREIDSRRRGNSFRCRDDHQPGRPSPARRRRAGRGARRKGAGLHRASIK